MRQINRRAGAELVEVAEPAPPPAPGPSPFRSRFGFLLGALIGVALAAIVGGVLLTTWSSGPSVPAGWSAWKPTADDRFDAVRQIADHVGPLYRLGDGNQLVAVQAGPLEIAHVPLSVALRSSANGGDIQLIDGKGVMFTLNGLGPRGSIARGTPSKERHMLLRREALELALYTFQYRDDVDMVVALLPPAPPGFDPTQTDSRTQALFFRPGDLRSELNVPLDRTLPPRTPRPETLSLNGAEAHKIEALTRSNLFWASFQQGQDAHAFLVLDRMPG
jgi:hypothetical protein